MQLLTLIAKGLCSFVRLLKRTAVVLESPALKTTSLVTYVTSHMDRKDFAHVAATPLESGKH